MTEREYFVPEHFPTCCRCGSRATVVAFLSEQYFMATLTSEGLADENHCAPLGLPEKIGDDAYFCDTCKPAN